MSKFHYPASPNVNIEEIVKVSSNYRKHVIRVLLSIIVFIIGYLIVLALAIALIFVGGILALNILKFRAGWLTLIAAIGIIIVVVMFFVFIVKFMFKIKKDEHKNSIEIFRKDHPNLFEFIEKVCEETKAPFPKKIIISPIVNASVYYNSSFLSMFFSAQKNLEIGLGLVSSVNLTEFKAIIAHEFGHFSQSSTRLGSYVYRFNRMIHDLLYDNDSWANALNSVSSIHSILSIFVTITIGMANLVLRFFIQLYKIINVSYMSLSREMEFHADLVAVSVSGSSPIISALHRLDFANEAYNYTLNGINEACKENKRYPQNFFSLLQRNINFLSTLNNLETENGLPVINSETISTNLLENRIQYKDVWATHPPIKEREKNARKIVLEAEIIKNSPWELFSEPEKLQEKLSKQLTQLNVKGNEVIPNSELLSYFEKEEKENYVSPLYKDFYSYATNTFAIPVSTYDETAKEILKLQIQDLFNDAVIHKLKRHNKNIYDTQIIKSISEGNLIVKRFEFDGKPHTRYYSSNIYQQLKKETEEEEVWIKSHIQKIVSWFYLKGELKDATLAEKYKSLMSFRDKMAKDREPLLNLFNQLVEFYHKELNKNLDADDIQSLRKRLEDYYKDYTKIKNDLSENGFPVFLLTEEELKSGYKTSIFYKTLDNPSAEQNLNGFGGFVDGIQDLIGNWAKIDTKIYKLGMQVQEDILKLIETQKQVTN